MKVLHINGARSWGGNEQQLVDLIPSLEVAGVNSFVMGIKEKALHSYCNRNNINFVPALDKKLSKKQNYKHLKKVVKEIKPDLIHLHTSDSVTLYTISDILYNLRVPAVFSKKGIGKSMSILSKYKYNYKNIKAIICVSEIVKTFMLDGVIKKKNESKLSVIYDCVNTERVDNTKILESVRKKYNISNSKKIIGNIANHVDAKDIPTLLLAIEYLIYKLKFTSFKLLQVGSFSGITKQLKEKAKQLKIEDYIVFTDFVPNASGYMHQFDMYVMSSQREGGPSSVLEAFYCNLPVVSTRVGILPEVIINGKNGFVVPIKDYKELADKIKVLLETPALQKQFKEESHSLFMSNFTAVRATEKTIAVYNDVLGI